MPSFLAWLYSLYARIYDWFINLWDRALNVVYNAFNWAIEKANWAYSSAVDWAWSAVNSIAGWIRSEVNNLWNSFNSIYSTVSDWISERVNNTIAWLREQIDAARNYADYVIESVRDWLISLIQNSISEVSSWVYGIIERVRSEFDPLRPLFDRIENLLAISHPFTLANLLALLSSGYENLLQFMQHPGGFIVSLLWPHLESLICYTLAKGMGTTKYDLPDKPSIE